MKILKPREKELIKELLLDTSLHLTNNANEEFNLFFEQQKRD